MKVVDNGTQASGNQFTDGNSSTGLLGTIVDSSWLNCIQTEMKNVVLDDDSGITELSQDNSNLTQLITAIRAIIDAKIATIDPGEGGSATGTEVKVTESILNSDNTSTSTSSAEAKSMTYTPIAGANDRYVDFQIDWSVKDLSAAQGQAIVELQKYNGSWSTVQTLYNQMSLPTGKIMVKNEKQPLASSATTSNSSNTTTGLQIDYTAVDGANKRVVKVGLDNEGVDSSGPGVVCALILQYYNGGSWVDLKEVFNRVVAQGATSITTRQFISFEYEHLVTDATPQYRVVQRLDSYDSGDSTELYAGSWIEVTEYEEVKITEQRVTQMFTYLDTETNASPQYRIMHKVGASGDTSIIRAGSLIRVREIN